MSPRGLFNRLALTARTAVRLTPAQTLGRLLKPPGVPLVSSRTEALPRWRPLLPLSSEVLRDLSPAHDPVALARGSFRFLACEQRFPGPIDWHPPKSERLWRYHLHYLDWAVALALAGEAYHAVLADRLDEWLDANPPGTKDSWEPYPLSLRVVNLFHILSLGAVRGELAQRTVASIAQQARSLAGGVETALQGNHLVKNGKALLVSGLAFFGEEAAAWFRRGRDLMCRELDVQVGRDGGHFERSPMYHLQVLADYLEAMALLNGAGRSVPKDWPPRVAQMLAFAAALTHPDGDPAQFGDTALGMAPTASRLARVAVALGIPATRSADDFPETRYHVARNDEAESYLVVDAGPIGPALQPGHGHCQLFSYELSLAGRRVVTDSGVATYEEGAARIACRGTAAHNTVTWSGREQSEIWAAFRVARRATVSDVRVARPSSGALELSGRARGFFPGFRRGAFRRELRWSPAGALVVADFWEAPRRARGVASRIHFSPDLEPRLVAPNRWQLEAGGRRVADVEVTCGDPHWMTSSYYPTFGVLHERPMLEIGLSGGSSEYRIAR
jgi:hypothetical protein